MGQTGWCYVGRLYSVEVIVELPRLGSLQAEPTSSNPRLQPFQLERMASIGVIRSVCSHHSSWSLNLRPWHLGPRNWTLGYPLLMFLILQRPDSRSRRRCYSRNLYSPPTPRRFLPFIHIRHAWRLLFLCCIATFCDQAVCRWSRRSIRRLHFLLVQLQILRGSRDSFSRARSDAIATFRLCRM
jgi:hypothetical protein